MRAQLSSRSAGQLGRVGREAIGVDPGALHLAVPQVAMDVVRVRGRRQPRRHAQREPDERDDDEPGARRRQPQRRRATPASQASPADTYRRRWRGNVAGKSRAVAIAAQVSATSATPHSAVMSAALLMTPDYRAAPKKVSCSRAKTFFRDATQLLRRADDKLDMFSALSLVALAFAVGIAVGEWLSVPPLVGGALRRRHDRRDAAGGAPAERASSAWRRSGSRSRSAWPRRPARGRGRRPSSLDGKRWILDGDRRRLARAHARGHARAHRSDRRRARWRAPARRGARARGARRAAGRAAPARRSGARAGGAAPAARLRQPGRARCRATRRRRRHRRRRQRARRGACRGSTCRRERSVARALAAWRARMLDEVRARLTGDGRALVESLVLGDRGDVPRPLDDAFRSAGVSHVLSVSGLHLAIAAFLFYVGLRRAVGVRAGAGGGAPGAALGGDGGAAGGVGLHARHRRAGGDGALVHRRLRLARRGRAAPAHDGDAGAGRRRARDLVRLAARAVRPVLPALVRRGGGHELARAAAGRRAAPVVRCRCGSAAGRCGCARRRRRRSWPRRRSAPGTSRSSRRAGWCRTSWSCRSPSSASCRSASPAACSASLHAARRGPRCCTSLAGSATSWPRSPSGSRAWRRRGGCRRRTSSRSWRGTWRSWRSPRVAGVPCASSPPARSCSAPRRRGAPGRAPTARRSPPPSSTSARATPASSSCPTGASSSSTAAARSIRSSIPASQVIAPFLWRRGIRRIDLMVLSHPHPDHANGLATLVDSFDVGEVWTNGAETEQPGTVALPRRRGAAPRRCSARRGRSCSAAPPSVRWRRSTTPARSPSIRRAARTTTRSSSPSAGAAARSSSPATSRPKARRRSSRAPARRSPPTWSRCRTTARRPRRRRGFVAATHPSMAVISVGERNRWGFPNPGVTARWRGAGARVWRTDRDGGVTVTVDSRGQVAAEGSL